MTDEDPPDRPRGRNPAERAGATPLDPDRFRSQREMPVVRRQPGPIEVDRPTAPRVVRRHRHRGSRRGFPRVGLFGLAAALAVSGVAVIVLAVATEPELEVASGAQHDLSAVTPVLSARRTPTLLTEPVAARNLRAAVQPVVDAAPDASCLRVDDGGTPLVLSGNDAPLVPASNMKLLTAAAAIDLLDPDERRTTTLVTDGAPTDGSVVVGNLYLVGGGDPMLSTAGYLEQLPNGVPPATDIAAVADQVVASGVREIIGSVVGDESRYDLVRTLPAWPERFLTQGQVGPLSALIVDDGWRPGLGPTDEPAVHAASVLTGLLEERGVSVAGPPLAGIAPEGAALLTEVPSLTVAELAQQALRFSDNTTTELLVKEIGLQHGGVGSTAAGLEAIRNWMTERGLPDDGVVLDDGSGLSEESRLTCDLLSAVLVDDGPAGVVADGLAVPGQDGTLRERLTAPPLGERVRAKTGSLLSVAALSGWLGTDGGRQLGFSFVINTPGRQVTAVDLGLQQQLLASMVGHPSAPPVDQLAPLAPAPPE